jgi:hypothetical protein
MVKWFLLHKFIPAAFLSNFTPLLVIFVNKESTLEFFEYKMWNLLFIDLEQMQEENEILALIEHYKEECEAGEYLYIYLQEVLTQNHIVQILEQNDYKVVLQNYTPKRLNVEKMMALPNEQQRLEMMMDALAFEEF